MTAQIRSPQIETMAWTIDRNGIDVIPVSVLRELGFEARRAGVRAAVTEVLVDTTAPSVVRNRAFGFIARALGRRTTTESTRVPCAA